MLRDFFEHVGTCGECCPVLLEAHFAEGGEVEIEVGGSQTELRSSGSTACAIEIGIGTHKFHALGC